jgi:hypothetical protein
MPEMFDLALMPRPAFGQKINPFKVGGPKGLQSESYMPAMYRIERTGVNPNAGWFLHTPIILVNVVKFAFTIAGMVLGFQFGYSFPDKLAQIPAASAFVLMLVFIFINRRYRSGGFRRCRGPGAVYCPPSAISGGALAALFHIDDRAVFLHGGLLRGVSGYGLLYGVKIRSCGIRVGWRFAIAFNKTELRGFGFRIVWLKSCCRG